MQRIINQFFLVFCLSLAITACKSDESNTNPESADTVSSLNIASFTNWKISSTPKLFPESEYTNNLAYGYNRAKLAWYTVAPLLLRKTDSAMPDHLVGDSEQRNSNLVRDIYDQEIDHSRNTVYNQPTQLPVLNLAFYPSERGPYNYDSQNVDNSGKLTNPANRWGGIMCNIGFTTLNKYMEFWVIDPFTDNLSSSSAGGDLYIDFGTISEDVLKDSRISSEVDVLTQELVDNVDTTHWGKVSKINHSLSFFDPTNSLMQDVGLDGLRSDNLRNINQEKEFFADYLQELAKKVDPSALAEIEKDPSSDNYHYFRGSDFDTKETTIIERYKNFNNPEGNSLFSEYSSENYSTTATNVPDNEDLNRDNLLNTVDAYREFKISLHHNDMNIKGQNYIDQIQTSNIILENGERRDVKWYHFRIPLDSNAVTVGNQSLNQSNNIRLYLTNFQDATVLRLVDIKLKDK